jgi:hypothetical protein
VEREALLSAQEGEATTRSLRRLVARRVRREGAPRLSARWGRDGNPKCLILYVAMVMGFLGLFGLEPFFEVGLIMCPPRLIDLPRRAP